MNIQLRPPRPGTVPDALHQRLADVAGRRVVVVGAGRSGGSAVRLLLAMGAGNVDVLDDKPTAALAPVAGGLEALGNVKVHGDGIRPEHTSKAHLMVVSPGVPRQGAWWDAALAANVPWTGDAELAWRCTTGQWLCVTGTNGKSTTTSMLGLLCRQEQPHTFVGGNLGTPACDAALADNPPQTLVMELSSYQCEGITTLDAAAAVLCNLTPDHLERYPSAQSYYAAKMRLLEAQSPEHVAVTNAADPQCCALVGSLHSKALPFAVEHGARGVHIDDAARVLTLHWDEGGASERFEVRNPRIRGRHNLENAAAAVAAARAANFSVGDVQRGLDAFEPVPHRLQDVGTLDGVLYVNDSKGTNVDATLKALASFAGNIHLIAGGVDKGTSYQPLADAAAGKVKAVYVVGQAAGLISNAMAPVCPVVDSGTLEVALERARAAARRGDVVLLSPACASFDQFRNFEHRGEVFAAWVKAHLAEGA